MSALCDLVRMRLAVCFGRWNHNRDGYPSTWDILRACGMPANVQAAAEIETFAGYGVIAPTGTDRDGARTWRITPTWAPGDEASWLLLVDEGAHAST